MNKQDTRKIMFLQTIWFTFLVVSLVACFFACIILGVNSKNVAYADDEEPTRTLDATTGYVSPNLVPINDCTSWDYNITGHSAASDITVIYEDSDWKVQLMGFASLVNNVLTYTGAGSGTGRIRFISKNALFTGNTYWSVCVGAYNYYQSTQLYADGNTASFNYTGYYYGVVGMLGGFDATDVIDIVISNGSAQLRWIYCSATRYFQGYVPKSYTNYGYDQGYLDGQNSGGSGYTEEDLEAAYQDGYDDGYAQGLEDGSDTILPVDSYNLVGSLGTLGRVSNFSYNGKSYVAYSGEEESFVDNRNIRYEGTYLDTQGDPDVFLGFAVDYLFKYSVKVRTIVYGTSVRWERVGFKIIAIDTVDNSSFTLTRGDTTYYSEFGSLGADSTNGTYVSAEFSFSFPNNHEYRLLFVPVNHDMVDNREELRSGNRSLVDNASMLIFEDTYFLSQSQGSLSYDDYNQLINDAYERGIIQGRTNGYDSGYSTGYSIGYNTGSDDAGTYTFVSLLGAVFDAPITAIVGKYDTESGTRIGGLLNFSVLGVNISGFVLALLSIGVVLFILRIFLRGV